MYEVECLTYDEEKVENVQDVSCDPWLGACHPDE